MIKNVFLLILLVVIQSCKIETSKNTHNKIQEKKEIENIVSGKTLYNIDNFKISTKYKFVNEINSDTLNSYLYQDLNNKIFYRINVNNLIHNLKSIGLEKFNLSYRKSFFDEYEGNLKNDKCDFKIVTFKNKKAITNNFIVTNNNLINNHLALLKAKSITTLNITKAYTISVIAEPETLETAFDAFIRDFEFIYDEDAEKYISPKYKYEILIPDGYVPEKANGSHIDFKVVSRDPLSIVTIDVSERTKEELNISAHDYTLDFIKNMYIQTNPQEKITSTEKIYIDNIEAFLVKSINESRSTNVIEIYFYKDNYGYLMTGTCKTIDYPECENKFLNTFYSLNFF
ncbi:hypothetical protein [uncultured Sunxiuqinia sp.]|uniref:hypothetical protein n=1 Tax=uncultured Sunxiuqinia sp. TaxID=1573825 RepID=UPI002AA81688|nr:hypothetical protein [uncultured Sunxiuqinia sp.]